LKRVLTGLVACLLALPLASVAADQTKDQSEHSAHPLLELARERERTRALTARGIADSSGVREAQHQIDQAHVPTDEECARNMGAPHFASLHAQLAVARTAEGDFTGAAHEYRSAQACRPHDPEILAALAGVLFDARDFAGTRAAITASLAIDARSVSSNRLAGNLDFVAEHWADAIARFRYVAASDDDRVLAGYGQLMLWLAQRRAGVTNPEFVVRTPGDGWPQPLLLYMRGEYTEAELIVPIRQGDDADNLQPNTSTDERLCEALYYVGEEYWARGEVAVARDYFAALVNIKVIYFLEHGLALAELAKLRAP
jgi:lipoprotein NlpI